MGRRLVMQSASFNKHARETVISKSLLSIALLGIFCWLIFFSFRADLAKDEWIYGDWLINYSAGFVRRGLGGSLILSQDLLSPPVMLCVIHFFLYGIFVVLIGALFWRHSNDLLLLTLLFSPLGLLFFVYSHYGIGRKEIVLLNIMLLQVNFLRSPATDRIAVEIYAAGLAMCTVITILLHEGLLFYCMFLNVAFIAYVTRRTTFKYALMLAAGIFCAQLIAFVICSLYKGTPEQARLICAALGGYLPTGAFRPIQCEEIGSIAWLGLDANTAAQHLIDSVGMGYLTTYGVSLVMGIAGFSLLGWHYRFSQGGNVRTISILLAVGALIATVPIFILSIDWGRWMGLAYLLLLFLWLHAERLGYLVRQGAIVPVVPTDLRKASILPLLAAVIYVGTWFPPLCCKTHTGYGVFSLFIGWKS